MTHHYRWRHPPIGYTPSKTGRKLVETDKMNAASDVIIFYDVFSDQQYKEKTKQYIINI